MAGRPHEHSATETKRNGPISGRDGARSPRSAEDVFDLRHLEDQGLIHRVAWSSTVSRSASTSSSFWRSRRSTTEAAMRRPHPDRDSPSTPAEAAVDGAAHSVPAWLRTSCELAAPTDGLEHRSADRGTDRSGVGVWLHGAPGVLLGRVADPQRRLRRASILEPVRIAPATFANPFTRSTPLP